MQNRSKQIIAALVLVAAVVALRLLPIYASEGLTRSLANLVPVLGLAFCGGLLLPRKMAAAITFGAFLISDVPLNRHYGEPVINVYSIMLLAVFAAIFFGGWMLRGRANLATTLLGTAGGVALFYIVTNSAAFFFDPAYPKTFAGWVQACSFGLPGFPPTWVFGLRSLAGNLVFALAFYLAVRPVASPTPATTAPAAA